MPPGQALPDRQPAYVASWIYVFGVLTLAALRRRARLRRGARPRGVGLVAPSSVGHFVNSLHLWSVELFFAFMVIHLWGKFWMAAWRGKRALTWVTGVVAFLASIGTAFTGYLSQSNFDSQWISAQAKDGLNSVGIGAWFNVLNLGQMLLWHVVLLPLVVGVIVVMHVCWSAGTASCRPLDAEPERADDDHHDHAPRAAPPTPDTPTRTFATRPYDLVKEFVVALRRGQPAHRRAGRGLLLPGREGDHDAEWAGGAGRRRRHGDRRARRHQRRARPTARRTTTTPTGQKLLGIPLQKWGGVRIPVDSAGPRARSRSPTVAGDPRADRARWRAGARPPRRQQTAWATALRRRAGQGAGRRPGKVPAGDYGPVPVLAAASWRWPGPAASRAR